MPDPLSRDDVLAFHDSLTNWGRWGDDDERGTVNFVTPEVTNAAASLVSAGRTVSCARPLNTEASADNPSPVAHHMIGTHTEGWGGDYLAFAPHGYAMSHLDALCHIFWDGRLYNGYETERVTAHGARRLGIHHLADGIVSRGVLLDIPAIRGVEALEPGERIFPDDLEAAEARSGVEVRSGDVLLVRTGRWAWRAEHGPWAAGERIAGLDARCLPWLHAREVAALGCDGVSDVSPSGVVDVGLPVHSVGIVAMGLSLVDNLDLEGLAEACEQEARWEFLLTIAPLVVQHGTASPVNPIAVF